MNSTTDLDGPAPAPGWGTVLSTWQLTPGVVVVDVLVVALAWTYVVGASRHTRWPVGRTASFLLALALLVATVSSGLSSFAPRAFAVHMAMHLLLIMVVPALWVAGRPLELLRDRLPPRGADAVDRALDTSVARAVTAPVAVLVVYTLVVVLTHLTGFSAAVATSPVLHAVEQLLYLGAGLLFFHTAVGVDLHPRRPAYFGRFVLMLVSMGVDTLVGITLMMAPASLLPTYRLDDVHLGGAIMWAVGDGLMMVIMVALSWSWVSDPSARVDFGPWLESARRAAFTEQIGDGSGSSPQGSFVAESSGPRRPDLEDIDEDDEALAAYNRMLARLHRRDQRL